MEAPFSFTHTILYPSMQGISLKYTFTIEQDSLGMCYIAVLVQEFVNNAFSQTVGRFTDITIFDKVTRIEEKAPKLLNRELELVKGFFARIKTVLSKQPPPDLYKDGSWLRIR